MDKTKTKSSKKITDTVKKIVGLQPAAATASTQKPAAEKKSVASVRQDDFFRRVQDKAYELYVNRSCTHGNDQDDWYAAERLVRSEMKAAR